ncbi:MAG: DUF5615 family PIN-like protein [Lewinellaceae bacterium]|nr:DUF5615 family PIN-like protein [Lewinellaceae bacterium]
MEKFLADESEDFRIVTHLREDGYEIEAIVEINPSISDEEVLALANKVKRNGRNEPTRYFVYLGR